MPSYLTAAALIAALALPAASARAQVIVRQGQSSPQRQPEQQQQVRNRQLGLHSFGSFTVGVPLFNDVDLDIVEPGANFRLAGGTDFGFVGVFAHIGGMFNPIDLTNVPALRGLRLGHEPLTRLYAGLGVRVQYPTEFFRPYVDFAIDFNFWHFQESTAVCGVWYCTSVDQYRFALGWETRVGAQIVVADPLAIDMGVTFAFTYPGDMFTRAEYWLEPYLGVATRF